jgi:hypothetical protein
VLWFALHTEPQHRDGVLVVCVPDREQVVQQEILFECPVRSGS